MWTVEGKTALVTGATSGIGYEIALGLAKQGAHVTIVGRNAENTARVVGELEAKSGAKIDFVLGDLSLMADVRKVAAEFLGKHDALHLLVNNAGVINVNREVTSEGLEVQFATNHLAVFLLTKLLLPALEKGAPSRVVTTSSGIHAIGKIHFEDLQLTKGYGAFKAYAQSKLGNVLFTQELARRVKDKGITANAVHPGFVGSNFANRPGVIGKMGNWFTVTFGNSPEVGAKTSLFVATADQLSGVTGQYFERSKQSKARVRNAEETAAKLWDVSEQLLK
ncbi:MAG: SDR family oxidoreductase [Archangium sp.]